MNKSIKGLLIDPENRTVTEVDIQAGEDGSHLESMCKNLNCMWVDTSRNRLDWLPGGCPDDVWFDDEGMFCEPKHFFQIPGWQAIAGRGLILGHDSKGHSVNHTLNERQVEALRSGILFIQKGV